MCCQREGWLPVRRGNQAIALPKGLVVGAAEEHLAGDRTPQLPDPSVLSLCVLTTYPENELEEL